MNIELKNVKLAAFASAETECFRATVVLDGVKAGTVANDGQGGAHRYNPHSLSDRLEAYAKTRPPVTVSTGRDTPPMVLQPDADMLIDQALTTWRRAKHLLKLLRDRVVVIRRHEPGLHATRPLGPQGVADLLACPEDVARLHAEHILNLLSFDEALRLYEDQANEPIPPNQTPKETP